MKNKIYITFLLILICVEVLIINNDIILGMFVGFLIALVADYYRECQELKEYKKVAESNKFYFYDKQ